MALFRHGTMSELSPECAPKRTSADHSEFMGSRTRNGAVASAVPSALTRGPAHFDWQTGGSDPLWHCWRGSLRTRSNIKPRPYPTAVVLICRKFSSFNSHSDREP
jgi:hypothetical protein